LVEKFKPFTIQHLRAIGDFARSYTWEVHFPEAPESLKGFFPANDFDEKLFGVESKQIEFFTFVINIPHKLNLPKFTISFYDVESKILYKWFRDWIANKMFHMNDGKGLTSVGVLEDIVKEVLVLKLNHNKEIIDMISYWVYPESIDEKCTSSSEVSIYSVPLIVAGMGPFK
jgi:hypothetical protein